MKKTIKSSIALFATALAFALTSCESTKQEDPRNKVEEEVDKQVVVDWTNRNLGEVSAPTWLQNLVRGNADTFKEQWKVDQSRVVKHSVAAGKTEATAQALSRAGFAYTQASELNQKIIGRVGKGLDDVGQVEALFVAASETKADVTGLREETGFFQKLRIKNAETKQTSEYYVYYTVYSMSKDTWDALCKKYLIDVMGGADLTTETQKKIGALFSEMKADADKKDAAKQKEEEALYNAQMARLETERAKANAESAKANAERAKANAESARANAEAANADSKASESGINETQIKNSVNTALKLASFLL